MFGNISKVYFGEQKTTINLLKEGKIYLNQFRFFVGYIECADSKKIERKNLCRILESAFLGEDMCKSENIVKTWEKNVIM